jgi:hypothetical protein
MKTRASFSNQLVAAWLLGASSLAAVAPVEAATTPVDSTQTATQDGKSAAARKSPPAHTTPYHSQKITEKAGKYYLGAWGVEKLRVSYTSSGNLIRFSYRVADAGLAKPLADKAMTPYLYGQRSRALLQVPVMDKVGMLRQAAPPEAGKEYWMVFSNKGNLVKPGDRVNVVIGAFHADGLMVE